MPVTRLIVVQGAIGLLNVLSILLFQRSNSEYKDCIDYLVIGGLYSGDIINQKMTNVCKTIAKIWNFKEVYAIKELQILSEIDFQHATDVIREKIGVRSADVVYTCRNGHAINELFLAAYPRARKICYGDGLGRLDLNSTAWTKPINPSGFVQMDDAYLLMPHALEKDAFYHCPIKHVPFDYFTSIVHESSKQVVGLAEFCHSFFAQFEIPPILVTTSNFTRAFQRSSIDEEIAAYLSCVLPLTTENDYLVVKGHPRQAYNQAQELANFLCAYGRRAVAIERFTQVPLELFTPYYHIEKAITLDSTSCLWLAYFAKTDLYVGLGEKQIKMYYPEWFHKLAIASEHMNLLLVQQAFRGFFEPTVFDWREDGITFHQSPIHMRAGERREVEANVRTEDIDREVEKKRGAGTEIIARAIEALNANSLERALDLFRESSQLHPDVAGLLYGRAVALARLARRDEAIEVLRQVLAKMLGHQKGSLLLEEIERNIGSASSQTAPSGNEGQ